LIKRGTLDAGAIPLSPSHAVDLGGDVSVRAAVAAMTTTATRGFLIRAYNAAIGGRVRYLKVLMGSSSFSAGGTADARSP
jgi:hypothetical protein